MCKNEYCSSIFHATVMYMNTFSSRAFQFAVSVGAALIGSQAVAAGPEMIVNGSFESPGFGAVGIYSAVPDGWSKSLFGSVSIINGNPTNSRGKGYGNPVFGVQYLGLDPQNSGGNYAICSQLIPGFVVGQKYLVSAYVADSSGGRLPRIQISLSSEIGGYSETKNYNIPYGGPYDGDIKFVQIQAVFEPTVAGSLWLSLENPRGNNKRYTAPGPISIDNVSVTQITEAEADALMLTEPTTSSSF